MHIKQPSHPKKTNARILLTSVFAPYARDDEFGSRKINPMELYHNQVTRVQGGFSLRMFHRSFSLLMLQANIEAPCTVLDFPSLEEFIREIQINDYDIVGISAIVTNFLKVKKMCELVREHLPNAVIVVGGHIANKENIEHLIDADYIVKGDGIQWFRRFLGQDETKPIKHPMVYSAFGTRIMGVKLPERRGSTAAILIPSVGCPMGCNFCSTSALFGGKGKFVNFYETGDQLFSIMCQIEEKLSVQSFFILDENFLLHQKRALRLLDLMKDHAKSWSLYVFSSAHALTQYTMEQLVELGIAWVWIGLEGENATYRKLENIDTRSLVRKLQSHGIRVLGSSIIGLETHTPENIDQVIEYAVSHNTDFHQFMLYTPNPGTPLYEHYQTEGKLLPESEFPLSDSHGQFRFNFVHPHIKNGEEEKFLIRAFQRDFEVNGPSLSRLIGTILKGWLRYKDHPDPRIRKRYEREVAPLRASYAGAVWAMVKWYKNNREMREKMSTLLGEIYQYFGWKTRVLTPIMGRYVFIRLKQEEKRLMEGWTYEPSSFCQKNAEALSIEKKRQRSIHVAVPHVLPPVILPHPSTHR